MLTYETSIDITYKYIRIGESTIIKYLKRFYRAIIKVRFCQAIIKVFIEEYLKCPTPKDITRLLKKGEERGFSRMLDSLDCMYWKWKNCPTTWARKYSRR